MKKMIIIGGVLAALGAGLLVVALVLDPFGLLPPKAIHFTPSKPPSVEVLALIGKVQSGGTDDRIRAMNDLAARGPDAEAAAPALIQLLHARDEDLRLNATLTLGKLGKTVAEPLAQTMKDRNPDVRYFSVWALGLIGPDAKDRSGDVLALLSDSSDQVRRKAAETLGRLEASSEAVVPGLIQAIGDPDPEVRQAATRALARLGPDAVPALLKAFDSDKPEVRLAALTALGEQVNADPPVLAALQKAFLSGDATLIGTASEGLIKRGKAAIPTLTEALDKPDANVRLNAVHALGRIGVDAAEVLVNALKNENPDVRAAAAQAFLSLQVTDKLVVQSLAEAMRDENEQVRNNAYQVLYNLGPGASGATSALGKIVADGSVSPQVRAQAAGCLAMIGPQAREAVTALQKALQDKDPSVRRQAQHALSMIGSR